MAASESYMRIAGKSILGRRYRDVFPELEGQGFFEIVDEVYILGGRGPGVQPPRRGMPTAMAFRRPISSTSPSRRSGARMAKWRRSPFVEVVDEGVAAKRARESAIVEAEASAARALRLQQVAAALNEAATPAEVAKVCVRHGMRALGADTGSLGVLVDGNAEFEIVYSAGYPPDVEERWRSFPLREGKPLSDAVLLRTPILLANPAEWEERYPDAASDLRHAGTVAFAATPIMVAGRVSAGLSFSFSDSKRFGPGERLFLATLGEQAAQAMERARLFDAERAARGTAERLQALTAALSGAPSTAEVADAAMHNGVRALHADSGVLALLTPDGAGLQVAASTGYPPEACMGPGRVWSIDTNIPIVEATRTGKPVYVQSPEEWGRRYLGGSTPASTRSASWAVLPIELAGRPAGALLWTYHAPRCFRADEVALMEMLARVCSQALERVWLLETERRARAEAEEANRSKTEFLSAMSHELRTPLNAIAGYVDLLDAGVRGPITELRRTDLQRIKRAQEMLLSLINDVLNFARLEAGRLEIDRAVVEVSDLLRELEDLMGNKVQARGLAFQFGACAEGLAVFGDAERVRQILLNLLSNAIKFTEPGGSIAVSAGSTHDQVSLRIADTGHGIPADRLEQIFEPFVQIDRRQIEESQQGVGLGLAISRELARAMGGDLSADSRIGEGSVFTLTLPRAKWRGSGRTRELRVCARTAAPT